MATALLTIGLAARTASSAISIHLDGMFLHGIGRAHTEILVDDGAHERTRTHRAQLEQADLLLGEAHLRNRIVDDYAKLRMKAHLEGIAAHSTTPQRVVAKGASFCCNSARMAMCQPHFKPKKAQKSGEIDPPAHQVGALMRCRMAKH